MKNVSPFRREIPHDFAWLFGEPRRAHPHRKKLSNGRAANNWKKEKERDKERYQLLFNRFKAILYRFIHLIGKVKLVDGMAAQDVN